MIKECLPKVGIKILKISHQNISLLEMARCIICELLLRFSQYNIITIVLNFLAYYRTEANTNI